MLCLSWIWSFPALGTFGSVQARASAKRSAPSIDQWRTARRASRWPSGWDPAERDRPFSGPVALSKARRMRFSFRSGMLSSAHGALGHSGLRGRLSAGESHRPEYPDVRRSLLLPVRRPAQPRYLARLRNGRHHVHLEAAGRADLAAPPLRALRHPRPCLEFGELHRSDLCEAPSESRRHDSHALSQPLPLYKKAAITRHARRESTPLSRPTWSGLDPAIRASRCTIRVASPGRIYSAGGFQFGWATCASAIMPSISFTTSG